MNRNYNNPKCLINMILAEKQRMLNPTYVFVASEYNFNKLMNLTYNCAEQIRLQQLKNVWRFKIKDVFGSWLRTDRGLMVC